MNAAQRRKSIREKIRKNEGIKHSVIRIHGEAVAVTIHLDGRAPLNVYYKGKCLVPFHEWMSDTITKAEYETFQEFGIPSLHCTINGNIQLDPLAGEKTINEEQLDRMRKRPVRKNETLTWPM